VNFRRRWLITRQLPLAVALALVCQAACRRAIQQEGIPAIELTSSSFSGDTMPAKYGCKGQNISPELSWKSAPTGTRSFVLLVTDKDTPFSSLSGFFFVHWVLYDVPGDKRELTEGIPTQPQLPDGSLQGRNDFDKIGYGGPCPHFGATHRYSFALYALDSRLNLSSGATEKQVYKAMSGHILAKGELVGRY
jgi:Raf kinase inhibitor-like YbhB/YbcL family protein